MRKKGREEGRGREVGRKGRECKEKGKGRDTRGKRSVSEKGSER